MRSLAQRTKRESVDLVLVPVYVKWNISMRKCLCVLYDTRASRDEKSWHNLHSCQSTSTKIWRKSSVLVSDARFFRSPRRGRLEQSRAKFEILLTRNCTKPPLVFALKGKTNSEPSLLDNSQRPERVPMERHLRWALLAFYPEDYLASQSCATVGIDWERIEYEFYRPGPREAYNHELRKWKGMARCHTNLDRDMRNETTDELKQSSKTCVFRSSS